MVFFFLKIPSRQPMFYLEKYMGDNFFRNSRQEERNFPGGPVVKTLSFHCGGARIQSLVREVPRAVRYGQKKKKRQEEK